jgi:hypothetical protein
MPNRTIPHMAWLIGAQFVLLLSVLGAVLWWQGSAQPRFAVVDVPQLYRLKEAQVAAILVDKSLNDSHRTAAIQSVGRFGVEVAQLIEGLPAQCGCLVFSRGAVTGQPGKLLDLTPTARERLGL